MPSAFAAILRRTETSLAAVIVIVAIVFSLSSPYFLTLSNASDLIEAYAVTTILAAGVFVVLVSGGIDISFAAVQRFQLVFTVLWLVLFPARRPKDAPTAVVQLEIPFFGCVQKIPRFRYIHKIV